MSCLILKKSTKSYDLRKEFRSKKIYDTTLTCVFFKIVDQATVHILRFGCSFASIRVWKSKIDLAYNSRDINFQRKLSC